MIRNDIYGLVLMGGLSQRMGQDKSQIILDNEKLYKRAARKLSTFTSNVYLSINAIQKDNYLYDGPVIVDKWAGQGPLSGIISAYESLKKPLFVLACDMPYADLSDMKLLFNAFIGTTQNTMFFNEEFQRLEPLISLWSLGDLERLDHYFKAGGRSFKQYLAQNPCVSIINSNSQMFRNLNAPSDLL